MIEDQGLEQDHKDEIVADVEDIADIQLEPVQESLSAAHDDFDWTIGKRNTVKYDDSECCFGYQL